MKVNHGLSFSDKMKKGLAENGVTTRSVVAFVMFGMIVAVFVLSDLSGRQSGNTMSMGGAAEVNGEIISLKDFQEEETRLSQYYSQLFGGQMDSEMQRNMLRNEAVNTLVTKSTAAQAAEKNSIYATDSEVRYMITQELPYFKKDGVFQTDLYKGLLQSNRLTPSEFESKLRKDIVNQRTRSLFEAALSDTVVQKNFETELKSIKLNIDFISIGAAEYSKFNSVSNETIKAKLADTAFKAKVESYFKNNQSQYDTQEQVKASHILVKVDGTSGDAAKKKAEDILKRTEAEDFGKLASAVSDDPGSKSKAGDLGYFKKGQMVKEFEEAAFTLAVGKVSGLIKTQFGYHIIKVTDKKEFAKATVESVENDIAKKLITDESYLALVSDVEKLLQTDTAAASAKLQQAGFKWQSTGSFDLSTELAPVMNSSQAVKQALSAGSVGAVSSRLVREGDTQFLVKLVDLRKEATQLKPQEQQLIEKQGASEAYAEWVNAFKKTSKINVNTALTSTVQ